MNRFAILEFTAALFCALLGTSLVLRRRSPSNWLFLIGMWCLALESLFDGFTLNAANPEAAARWQRTVLIVEAFLPGIWLCFSLVYSRGNHREFLARWRYAIGAAFMLPLVLAIGFHDELIRSVHINQSGRTILFGLGSAGITLYLLILVSIVVILTNLEKTFRAAVGTMRWRIKFVVLGLSVIFGAKIYTCSQAVLYSGLNVSMSTISAMALLLGCALIGLSYLRAGLVEIDVYPSHVFLYSSITVILVGIYLVIVGILARVVVAVGGDTDFPIKALIVMLGVLSLSLLLLSNRLRQATQRFVSRHLKRPFYDYRKVWNLFTQETARAADEKDLSATAAKLISDTLNALSVTIWLLDENRLKFAASTTLPSDRQLLERNEKFDASPVVSAFQTHPDPFDLDRSTEPWAAALREQNSATFREGGHRICVPIVAGDQALGMILLADRVNGIPFTLEELDLLKCIGNHLAASLLGIQLTQKLMVLKEHEAFKAVSTFFAHDLKNAASTLSLMLRNLPVHFDDPEFRQDVQRGISKTVDHMNHLINRLSLLRQQPEIKSVASDLNKVVTAALSKWPPSPGVEISSNLLPIPTLLFDPEQIESVVTNLILNARDAVGQRGRIHVETGHQNGWAILTVSDDGCGMSSEFVRDSLFRPFKSTKKDGTGIGMFQCKTVIEAHRGKMEVESELGKGTSFRVLLPITVEAKS